MSNRTFGVVKRLLMVVGVVLYVFVATRTTAYALLAKSSVEITWWNLPPLEPAAWFVLALLAALGTGVTIVVAAGLWVGIPALLHWIFAPRYEEALKDRLKAATPRQMKPGMHIEPDIVEVEPAPMGEYSQPPKPLSL